MKTRTVFLALLVYFLTASNAALAYTATGTISGRIISTSIVVNNQNFGNIVANSTLYYYWNGSALNYVVDNTTANDISAFASVDFATDSGYIEISIGTNNTLPSTARILIDNDKTPNIDTSMDATQIQIEGNGDTAQISYYGEGGDGKITYSSDGEVYVFVNTGDATSGDINIDLTITAT